VADLYATYAALAAATVEGVDYTRTAVIPAGSTWCAIAVHGGGIEGGSGEMAREVSAAGTRMAYYQFAGIRAAGNTDLHITSSNFDEPQALALVAASKRCLSFHGMAGTEGMAQTAIGGLDATLVASVSAALTRAGFDVSAAPSELSGTDPTNICNKTSSSAGVQLEMSRALRDSFFPPGMNTLAGRATGARTATFYRYVSAVRAALLGRGVMSLGSINVSRWALMPAPAADVDMTASVATDKLAIGGSQFVALVARAPDTNNGYVARLEFSTTQQVIVTVRKRAAGTETLISQTTTGLTHAADRRFRLRFQVAGTALRARVWLDGATEPTVWDVDTTDTALTAAGQIGMRGILSTTNTNTLPVLASWGDFSTLAAQQSMTVTRAVNGVHKAQLSAADVRLAHPLILAL
jgi:phage replication-related protein YjqB (UPF0714/DUF867 family)